jgi:Asp-tRNA(Asn)/Glu-tRNA(Gln) amidotransferase A subunit family amidase
MEQLRLDLADHGVEVVDLAIPNTQELVDWGIPVFFCDRLRQSRGLLRGQMVDAHVRRLLRCLNMPGVLRRSLIQTGRLTGGKRLANTLQALRPLNVKGLLHCLGRIHDMRDAFLQAWREAEIDAVITPAFPVTAFRHGESPRYSGGFGMLLMANLWDLPAGVVPVGVVEKDSSSDVVATSSSEARQRQPAAADDLEADGLPIGAQVIGGLLGDRTVIQVMKLLEKLHNDD